MKIILLTSSSILLGCAGPRFIEKCNNLATSCQMMYTVCSSKVTADDLLQVQLDVCNQENERLTKMILNEVPK